jgi:hypothetical protein
VLPIGLGAYAASKIVQAIPNELGLNTTYAIATIAHCLVYPFVFIQTKLLCEVSNDPAKRRYFGLDDMCNRIRHFTGTNMTLYRGFISYYTFVVANMITFSTIHKQFCVNWVLASMLTSLVTTPI